MPWDLVHFEMLQRSRVVVSCVVGGESLGVDIEHILLHRRRKILHHDGTIVVVGTGRAARHRNAELLRPACRT